MSPGTAHPSVVAKQVTSIDVISHGRALVGVGSAVVPGPSASGGTAVFEKLVTLLDALFTENQPESTASTSTWTVR